MSLLPQIMIAYGAIAILVSAVYYLFTDSPRAGAIYARAILWAPLLAIIVILAIVSGVLWVASATWALVRGWAHGKDVSPRR